LGDEGAGGGAFAAFVGYLALAQNRAAGVVDRTDQEDPAVFGAGAAQGRGDADIAPGLRAKD